MMHIHQAEAPWIVFVFRISCPVFFFPFSRKWHVNLLAVFCYKWPGILWGFKLLWEGIKVLHWWTIMGGVGRFLTDCNEKMAFIMYSFVCRIINDSWISSSWEEGLYSDFKFTLSRQDLFRVQTLVCTICSLNFHSGVSSLSKFMKLDPELRYFIQGYENL